MTGTGALLLNYLQLAIRGGANAKCLADPDVMIELHDLAAALNAHDEQAREIAALRTRLEHLEQHRETLDTYIEVLTRK